MTILFSVESYRPNVSGVVIFLERLANYLGSLGHKVIIITVNHNNLDPKEVSGNITIFRMKGTKNPFRKGLKFSSSLNNTKIREILLEVKPDVIHLQDIGLLSRAIALEAKKINIPVIASNHFLMSFILDYFVDVFFIRSIVKKFICSIAKQVYHRCEVVVTPTHFVKQELIKWGIKSEIQVISNGIELDAFTPSKEQGKDKIVLFVGRLDRDKNLEVLIRAIPIILASSPHIKFWFVGDGNDKERLEKIATNLNVIDSVVFYGFIQRDNKDFILKYRESSLLWLASAEAQSLVVLEAMASGLPIVASNCGAVPEIITDGFNGFLVTPNSVNGFAKAVLEIVENEEVANTFSLNNLEKVKGHHIDHSFYKINAIYQSLQNIR